MEEEDQRSDTSRNALLTGKSRVQQRVTTATPRRNIHEPVLLPCQANDPGSATDLERLGLWFDMVPS